MGIDVLEDALKSQSDSSKTSAYHRWPRGSFEESEVVKNVLSTHMLK